MVSGHRSKGKPSPKTEAEEKTRGPSSSLSETDVNLGALLLLNELSFLSHWSSTYLSSGLSSVWMTGSIGSAESKEVGGILFFWKGFKNVPTSRLIRLSRAGLEPALLDAH